MSIVKITTRLLSVAPRVAVRGRALVVGTSFVYALVTLFLHLRTVTIDTETKYIEVHTRFLWLFTRVNVVPFRHVRCISYRFSHFLNEWFFMPKYAMATDSIERYRLALVLNKPSEQRIHLFSVVGEGAIMTGALGVILGDSPVDFEGAQQQESLHLAERLGKVIGVPVGEHQRNRF